MFPEYLENDVRARFHAKIVFSFFFIILAQRIALNCFQIVVRSSRTLAHGSQNRMKLNLV